MITAYDRSMAPFDWAAILYLIFFALLFLGARWWKRSGRRMPRYTPAAILLAGLWFGGLPLFDQLRVGAMDMDQMSVTKGRISKLWDIRTRSRNTDPLSFQKHQANVTHGFDIGEESFSWHEGSRCPVATFCGFAGGPPYLREGQKVEITWFADPLRFGKRRIVKLLIES
ncbi:hypothetical protein [Sphingobium yanoikuyae]|uniref:hypothetical protein n=1 Tax=Sphingobium yanoikuyae TaxID=13690 RepID=UPI002FDA888E